MSCHPRHCFPVGRGWGQASGEESQSIGGGIGVGGHGGGARRGHVSWTRDHDDGIIIAKYYYYVTVL